MAWITIFASLTVATAGPPPHSHVLSPLKVQPLPSRFHGFEKFFSKYIPVLSPPSDDSRGVQVVATQRVPDDKIERVANVLAEYLDNDEDGWLDNAEVVVQMERRGATMIMFADSDELERSGFDGIPGFDDQDVEGDETGSNRTLFAHLMTVEQMGRSHVCRNRPDLICDAPLEEVFHLVTDNGFGPAYPKKFATRPGTSLTVSMDALIGDCGYASLDSPFGSYSKFRFPDCHGKYHYDDDTCDYSCLATEYFHHFVASYNGEYPWGRGYMCGNETTRAKEWELCADAADGVLNHSRQILKHGDPDFFALFTDPYFKVPLRMPDGNYKPRYKPPNGAWHSGNNLESILPVTAFKRIALQGAVRRQHRAQVKAKRSRMEEAFTV